jgi:hypothetical protein
MSGVSGRSLPVRNSPHRPQAACAASAKLGTSLSVFAQGGYQFATSESGANGFRRDSVKADMSAVGHELSSQKR